MPLIVLIGASGSGKTTIAQAIASRYPREIEAFYFDQIGVPPVEQMIAEYGSDESWQRAKTIEWLAKLATISKPPRNILFEGQTRLSFLAEAAAAAGGIPYAAILVDCDDETRARRLSFDRKQPELADASMMNWARYLRLEAQNGGCEILDTSDLSLEESISYVLARFRRSEGL